MKRAYLIGLYLVGMLWPTNFWRLLPISQRDFGSFWISGRALMAGVDPYDVQALKTFGGQLLGVANYNFTYPPHSLFLFLPFSLFSPAIGFILWSLVSALFFWWTAKPLLPKGMPTILAILTPAAVINLNYGQTGLICSGLFLLAFRGSGLAAAALTFKPHMGFLIIPAIWRSKRALLTAVVAFLLLVGASAAAFLNWGAFLDHALGFQGKMVIDRSQDQWLYLGVTPAFGFGILGWLLFAAGGAYFLSQNYNAFTAATATFLIAPYGLHYDMAAVCLGFAILIYSRWDQMSAWDTGAASLAFLTPLLVVYGTTWIVPPILLWALAVLVRWTDGSSFLTRTNEATASTMPPITSTK